MKQFGAEILENREVARDGFELRFAWPDGLRAPLPGQIVTVRSGNAAVPFLRSPIPIASFQPETRTASLLLLEGIDPQNLSRLKPGDTVDVLGPRGFPFQARQGQPLLVGGGLGTGALVFAANSLAAKGFQPLLILGLAGLQAPQLRTDPRVEVIFGAEMEVLLELPAQSDRFVWAAAPRARLKAIHDWSASAGHSCQVAMEQIIACGVGACQGCTIATTDARKAVRVCTEGPVFPSEVIDWT